VSVIRNADVFHFSLKGNPISKVEIVGIVVACQIRKNKILYKIDDGTAVMRCIKYISQNTDVAVFETLNHYSEIGRLVSVRGTLSLLESNDDEFGFALSIMTIGSISDPNYEVFHWLSVMQS
jgi:hypothetical protein